jgi:hypothetical protein
VVEHKRCVHDVYAFREGSDKLRLPIQKIRLDKLYFQRGPIPEEFVSKLDESSVEVGCVDIFRRSSIMDLANNY